MAKFDAELVQVMRAALEEIMQRVPVEHSTQATKAHLAECILKAAAQGKTSFDALVTAAAAHIPDNHKSNALKYAGLKIMGRRDLDGHHEGIAGVRRMPLCLVISLRYCAPHIGNLPIRAEEFFDLAATCEEVANDIEDRLPGG